MITLSGVVRVTPNDRGMRMAYYRLYFMDERTGHLTSFMELVAESDRDALMQAEDYRGRLAMELWCGRTKVKHWPANFETS
jgi:hypothetical protein